MKYQVIRANTILELEEAVNKAIAAGWLPTGGVSFVGITNDGYTGKWIHYGNPGYIQAMTKVEH